MKEKISEFTSTIAALDFIDELHTQKIKGVLNYTRNKDGSFTFLVTYIPKKSKTVQK
jgi:hypothetical protein